MVYGCGWGGMQGMWHAYIIQGGTAWLSFMVTVFWIDGLMGGAATFVGARRLLSVLEGKPT